MNREKIYDDKYYEPTPKEEDKIDYRRKKVIEIFSTYNLERIFDISYGDGNFSILLKKASNAKEVYGIKMSEKGVEYRGGIDAKAAAHLS